MDPATIATFVEAIRHAPLDVLNQLSSTLEMDNRLPLESLAHLNNEDKLHTFRACLIVLFVTELMNQGQVVLNSMAQVTLTAFIEAIRCAPLDVLNQLALALEINDRLPLEFLACLNSKDKLHALRACLITFLVTKGRIVPRAFQLEASLATVHQRDSIVIAGMGSGKTLCFLIPILLHPESISVTVSPLKRLQVTQVRLDKMCW